MNTGSVTAELRVHFVGRHDADAYENKLKELRRESRRTISQKLDVKTDKRSFSRASASMRDLDRNAKSMRGGLLGASTAASGMGKGMLAASLAATGLFAAFQAGKESINTTVDLAKATGQLSTTMRLGIPQAGQWAELLKVYGIDSTSAAVGMGRLNSNLSKAAGGSKTMADALGTLGFKQREFSRLKPDEVIGRIANYFKAGRSPSQSQLAAGTTLLGRNFKTLLPLLRGGGDGIDRNLALIRRYGAYLSGGGVRSVAQFRAKQREMTIAFDAVKIAIGERLLPMILEAMPKITELIDGFRGHGPMKDFADNVKTIASTVGDAAVALGDFISTKGGAVATITAIGVAMAVAAPEITAAGAAILALVAAYKYLDRRAASQRKKDQTTANKVANDPLGQGTAADRRKLIAGSKVVVTASPSDRKPNLGASLGQTTARLAKRFGATGSYQMSVALNTKDAAGRLSVLDAAAKSKLSKPKILKILGDKTNADTKIKQLQGQKVKPKTAVVFGNTNDANRKLSVVARAKIQNKSFIVRVEDWATGILHDVRDTLSDIANTAVSLPAKLWHKLFGRGGGRARNLPAMAGGGRVPGARVAKDNQLAMLSPGEFIVTGDGERQLEGMTFPGVLSWLEKRQLPHFAAGGRVAGTPKKVDTSHARAYPSDVTKWDGWLSDQETRYGQREREAQLSGEGIDQTEYNDLKAFKIGTRDAVQRMVYAIPGALKRARTHVTTADRDAHSKGKGNEKRRKRGAAALAHWKPIYEALKTDSHDLPYRLKDLQLDVTEIGNNKRDAAETTVNTLAAQFADFQASRAQMLSSYGSNFVSAGAKATDASGLAGYRYYGAGMSGTPVSTSGRSVSITNHYLTAPSDPHAWSASVHYELGALT